MRNVPLNNVPNDVQVNAKVPMDSSVTEPRNIGPGDFGMCGLEPRGETLSGLGECLQSIDRCIPHIGVREERLFASTPGPTKGCRHVGDVL